MCFINQIVIYHDHNKEDEIGQPKIYEIQRTLDRSKLRGFDFWSHNFKQLGHAAKMEPWDKMNELDELDKRDNKEFRQKKIQKDTD